MKSFDRLARVYRLLERVAFGDHLDEVRRRYVGRLRSAGRVLIVGDGDGRFLRRLLDVSPTARATSIDVSAAMLDLARARLSPADATRVTFQHGDVRQTPIEPSAYDAVVTLFVLDCFTPDDVQAITARLSAAVVPDGLWIFGDFAIPDRGWRRWRARLIVGGLYVFFRWQTGIEARHVPPSERLIAEAGFRRLDDEAFSSGLLRAALFVKRGR